jgi:hypothetical protein
LFTTDKAPNLLLTQDQICVADKCCAGCSKKNGGKRRASKKEKSQQRGRRKRIYTGLDIVTKRVTTRV